MAVRVSPNAMVDLKAGALVILVRLCVSFQSADIYRKSPES